MKVWSKEKSMPVFQLGKHKTRYDSRTPKLANYYYDRLLAPPTSVDYTDNIPANGWGMMKNDTVGDCTCAAVGHIIEELTNANGNKKIVSDKDIIAAYSAVSGYNPVTGSNDNGADMLTVLQYWQRVGVGGDKLDAFASLNPAKTNELKQSVYLFGSAYIGIQLPLSAQGQTVWRVQGSLKNPNNQPGSWGGHCVSVVKYGPEGLWVVTWGGLLLMGYGFWQAYGDEAYAPLDDDWIGRTGLAPNAVDLSALKQDLELLVA